MTTYKRNVFELRGQPAELLAGDAEPVNHQAAGRRHPPIKLIQQEIELLRSAIWAMEADVLEGLI
jgi:hypothetical protein